MANESSAVARFIDLVQKENYETQTASPPPPPVFTGAFLGPATVPDMTHAVKPQSRVLRIAVISVALTIVVAGVAVAAFILAKQTSSPEGLPAVMAGKLVPPTAEVAPALAPEQEQADKQSPINDPAVLEATGFDIVVTPSSAKISLDGREIGVSPLRVRNLLPGEHSVDVSAPKGYFAQHMRVQLKAGQAETLTIELVQVDSKGFAVTNAEQSAEEGTDEAEANDEPTLALDQPTAEQAEESAQEEGEHGDEEESKKARQDKDSAKDRKRQRRRERAAKRARRKTERRERRREQREARAERAVASAPAVEKSTAKGTGTLMLGSKPPCDIYIDGNKTGLKTPQRAIKLSAGTHKVTLINKAAGIKKRFRVKIGAGKTTRAIQDFTDEL